MRRAIAGGASGAAGRATPDAAAPVLRLHTHSTAAALAADIKGGQGGVGGEGVSGCCFQSGCLRPRSKIEWCVDHRFGRIVALVKGGYSTTRTEIVFDDSKYHI